jgi:ribosomal-protein-alanine N-acetyltransferase
MTITAEPIVRPMVESDLDSVLTIEQASFSTPWKRDHFLHEITAPHSYPFVAVYGGTIAGYVCLTALFEEAQILDIAVAPDVRGRGIARALMQFAAGLAREKGAEVLLLEVRSTNHAAISLYERFGFSRCGVRVGYYDGLDDALLMEKNLQGESSCSLLP